MTEIKGSSGWEDNEIKIEAPSGVDTRVWEFYKLDRLEEPSTWLYLADSSRDEDEIMTKPQNLGLEGSAYFVHTDSNNNALYMRHMGSANGMMADMHVQIVTPGNIRDMSNKTTSCNPDRIGVLRYLTKSGIGVELW